MDGRNARHGSDGAHLSYRSNLSRPRQEILPPNKNYHLLLSFQKAEVIFDITFRFAHRYLAKGDRTLDQMIQAACSGKKNLLEGSKASQTSTATEIKLTGVARASLEELLDDYIDFQRTRDQAIWQKIHRKPSTLAGKCHRPTRYTARLSKRARRR